MRWVWVWLAMGCASQRSAESHADYVAEVQTTRTEGAERVTRVVEVFSAGAEPTAAVPVRSPNSAGEARAPEHASASTLIRRTTTTIDRAPIITETHSGTDLHTDAESASSHSWFHLGFLAWAGIAAGAVAAALLAYKFRSGLAGGVLRALGRG